MLLLVMLCSFTERLHILLLLCSRASLWTILAYQPQNAGLEDDADLEAIITMTRVPSNSMLQALLHGALQSIISDLQYLIITAHVSFHMRCLFQAFFAALGIGR
jgi:hypothetical protein